MGKVRFERLGRAGSEELPKEDFVAFGDEQWYSGSESELKLLNGAGEVGKVTVGPPESAPIRKLGSSALS